MRKLQKKPKEPPKPEYPKVIETFRDVGNYQIGEWESDNEPTCFNGWVHVRKYRITIEEIDEPVEVIRSRLLKLWHESDNHHHYEPLHAIGLRYGIELANKEFGKDRKRR